METKNRILTKARKMFVKQGIRCITMDYIANDLGISKRTIYRHFKDKKELLINCIKTQMVVQKTKDDDIIIKAPNCLVAFFKFMENSMTSLKAVNPNYFADLEKYYPEIWESKIIEYENYRLNRITELLKRGKNKSLLREDLDVEIIAITTQNMLKSLSTPFLIPRKKHSTKRIFENTIENYFRGLLSQKGLQQFYVYKNSQKKNIYA